MDLQMLYCFLPLHHAVEDQHRCRHGWRSVSAAVAVDNQLLAPRLASGHHERVNGGHDVLEPGQSNESSQMFK